MMLLALRVIPHFTLKLRVFKLYWPPSSFLTSLQSHYPRLTPDPT